ncbi:hypothetical protein NDA12_007812 [Ustilago hordei]|nr:hypothetical protein NDA15_002173 [Ustilago hordei]KAJ1594153.1 hypothetical protein NDA12_007812 [Ustilago hordei]
MTSSTDDSGDISAELLCQSTTPTSSATQTKSVPVLSQSGSTSAPDIHTSCPTQASRSATGKKNLTWSGANVLHLVTILYNNDSYQHTLLPSRESAESNPALKLCKHPIFQDISKMIFPGTSVDPNRIKSKLRWLLETYYREKKKLSPTGAGTLLEDMDASCHGPGCSRSRRVMGSYGRSTGIEDLVDTSREHGRSAVSMETMDSYGLTCKGGPSTATRRTKLKEQAQPRGGPSSRSRHSHEEDQAQGACRWLPLRGSRDKSQRNCH